MIIAFRFVPFGVVIVVLLAPALASGGINDNGENGGVILFVLDTFEVGLIGRVPCCSSVSFDNFCFRTLNSTSFASMINRFPLSSVKRLLYSLLRTGIFDLLAVTRHDGIEHTEQKCYSPYRGALARPLRYIGMSAFVDFWQAAQVIPPSPQRGSLRRRLDGMNFLAELFQSGASYSAVNTSWSALSSI